MKNAIVTGGNSGIGYATAKLLKESGYQVLITGRNEQRLQKAASELGVEYAVADMGDIEALKTLAQSFTAGLNYLVCCAAGALFKPIDFTEEDEFDEFMRTNVKGSYFFIKALLPGLIERQGSITIVTSAIVDNGLANASLYALSKGAMDSLTHSLSVEIAPKGVRINCVAPGAINTEIRYKLGISDEQFDEIKQAQEQMIPLGRFGEPSEVAHVIKAQLEAKYETRFSWKVCSSVAAI